MRNNTDNENGVHLQTKGGGSNRQSKRENAIFLFLFNYQGEVKK